MNDERKNQQLTCDRCDGCGQIADDEDGIPWIAWESIPRESQLAISTGTVKSIPCPECNGTGKTLKPVSHEPDLFDEPRTSRGRKP